MRDDVIKRAMAQHRAARFKAQISTTSESTHTGEFALQVTHNGSQWQNMYLNANEAETVIRLLQDHLGKQRNA